MDKEKEIEELAIEMAKINCKSEGCDDCDCAYEYGTKADSCEEYLHYYEIAKRLYGAGYRKTEEVTLKLDLGDRTPEEIEKIAKQFSMAMSTTPIPVISLSDNEIRKETAKEIFEMLIFWTQSQKTWGKTIDIDELIQCLQRFAREKGVEIK